MLTSARAFHPVTVSIMLLACVIAVTCQTDVIGNPTHSKSPKWEYTTATVEAAALASKLNKIGVEGWEVFSIERASLLFEQDAEKKTHLISETYQLTARRPAE